jgi:hypothetical protein
MPPKLKKAILQNVFADEVLGFHVDEQAFEELCALLEQLTIAWRDKRQVDKQVVMHLYHTTHIVRNRLEHFRRNGNDAIADRLEDMFIELDRLFGECCLKS